MLNRIIEFSIKNKLIIGALTIGLIIWGVYSLNRLPIDAQPDITNNQVQIITQAPTLGAQEVEQFITAPIELEMANIPRLTERRSISRSGISVITLVFEDEADTYWARSQVSEHLVEAEKKIPQGVGDPSLAPISTGLGEIYQYVLHTKKGYENKYSPTDLRTFQDWIVRTQLAGTPGVAEVSGWGGYVKQYEIAINNDRLNSLNVTIGDIYKALEENNENTGGSYIEQRNNAYTIRGIGLVKTLSDIEKIVVKSPAGIPILVRDVATVQFGSATRYGAVTRNGEGEVVGGITLMLKGENFHEVIQDVKRRMQQIQKSLPEGVVIEPFIDRTQLVDRTINTVKRNLIEGGLIVVFVLVLLLGNLRAGLIVASVIPLAMLFAFAMMRLFQVSGNLMSLGAIDFGLIVDGAVIIVEAIVHRLRGTRAVIDKQTLNQQEMDKEVFASASKIRSSAAFGEIIILIVYLPLFALVGIEGKMFRPMAETVAFAILGAFILSLTYVPMVSALFLSKHTVHKRNISDRIIERIQAIYEPLLRAALRIRAAAVVAALIIFAVSAYLFSRMGGEFIPTLEEGDLTVEVSMMQGTSLSQTIETFSKAEKILKTQFPEVKQVVTRIGSAEIPTDPMPLERGDMMVSMRPKDEWKTAETREEMMEKMEKALSVLPGLNIEITQPMQMRFNELMTGVRQDVAIKIFGDDLEVLSEEANKVAAVIKDVKGVTEPYVEKVSGLPQIVVVYNRDKIAQYGLSISDVNRVLRTAFAGDVAGVVFEGEKRFDMVVRLQRDLRENISNIEKLFIALPSGSKVPLDQVADISFKEAPAQISREEGKRRIYVGFNVRGRDVESTIQEIESLLNKKVKFQPGYYTTYGGQFQNLQEAKKRLGLAVPAALLLILFLLYITFRSIKQMLLIFTAVPLSAIGGILALMLRGMPFSISAGVGFIALFGVAVLNGIVLIGQFNQLEAEGVNDIYRRVLEGTKVRLRPVVMTASVASLGFLPMALSTSAGAEVQKPLATVVIGGLVTATLLTLFVLPCLYIIFQGKKKSLSTPRIVSKTVILVVLGSASSLPTKGQDKPMNLQELIRVALQNNLQLQSSNLEVQQSRALEGTAFDVGRTSINLSQDPTSGGGNDNSIGIQQSIGLLGYYKSQHKVLLQQTATAEGSQRLTEGEIIRSVQSTYYEYLARAERVRVLEFQDSLYRDFREKALVRYKTGETSRLEQLTANSRYQEVQLQLNEAKADLRLSGYQLQHLINSTEPVLVAGSLNAIPTTLTDSSHIVSKNNRTVDLYRQHIQLAEARIQAERRRLLPEINLGYSRQLVIKDFNPAQINREYFPGTRIAGFQVGLGIPLFFGASKARIKSEKIGLSVAKNNLAITEQKVAVARMEAYNEFEKYKDAIAYYQSGGLQQTNEQIRIAQVAFRLGEIGYIEYLQNISLAIQSKLQYLTSLNQYNQAIINLNYLNGGNQNEIQ